MKQDIERHLPLWYRRYRTLLSAASFILLIPSAAVVLEVAVNKLGIYTSSHPWPLWFRVLALVIGIPSAILLETLWKLDKLSVVIRGLRDAESKTRKESALNLRESRSYSKYAIPALIEALKDTNEEVISAVVETLQHLTGQNLGKNQDEWQRWHEQSSAKGTHERR